MDDNYLIQICYLLYGEEEHRQSSKLRMMTEVMLRFNIGVIYLEINCAEDFIENGFNLSLPIDFHASILRKSSVTILLETGDKLKE